MSRPAIAPVVAVAAVVGRPVRVARLVLPPVLVVLAPALRLVLLPVHPAPALRLVLLAHPVLPAPVVTCPGTFSGRIRRKANCNSWSIW